MHKKDTMITMEWLHPLSFPWLKQELTSAFWRQTPLYLGIFNNSRTLDAFLKASRNWSLRPDWMIGSNGFFPTSKFQSCFCFPAQAAWFVIEVPSAQEVVPPFVALPPWASSASSIWMISSCHHDPIRMFFFQHSWIWSNIAGWTLLAEAWCTPYTAFCGRRTRWLSQESKVAFCVSSSSHLSIAPATLGTSRPV